MNRKIALLCVVLAMVHVSQAATKIACIGDSITYGTNLSSAESYPTRLQELLDAAHPGEYEVRNFGNPGRGVYLDSMRGTEKRGFRWMKEHSAALAWQPDVVICNLGINDCGEFIKEFTGERERGNFVRDYVALLDDYKALPTRPQLFIWRKLSPLAPGQKFYRSSEPFLMQRELDAVCRETGARGIDMFAPLQDEMDSIFVRDRIHPDARGAKLIAKATFDALHQSASIAAPAPSALKGEVWLAAGQSNMQKGWGEFMVTGEERARGEKELAALESVEIYFWDFNDGSFIRLTPENAKAKSAFGVSFAIRRAKAAGCPVTLLYVAAGGASTEAFLSEATMCSLDASGRPKYPRLAAIATNRHRLDANADYPCLWVAREYPRRRNNLEEGHWWPVSALYDAGIAKTKSLHLDGILWYQGESNASTCVAPDSPTDRDYQVETLRAAIEELRSGRDIPFVVMGLPKMNRPWAQYRSVQKQVCDETGAIFVDTFAAGLGDERDVHPRDKIPFADLAASAAALCAAEVGSRK